MSERLPIENLEDGLYVHPGTRTMAVSRSGGVTRYWVDARDFMQVQKERDDYRRAIALVNAWRVAAGVDFPMLTSLCESVGLTVEDAHAINAVIRGLQDG